MRSSQVWSALLVLFTLCLLSSCKGNTEGSVETSRRTVELEEVWQLYNTYLSEKNRPPTSIRDLQHLEPAYAVGYQALLQGQCVAYWNVNPKDRPNAGETILAYEKDAPKQGGYVLLLDGKVKSMTAEEFKAAPKAGR